MQVDEENKRNRRKALLPSDIERNQESQTQPNVINSVNANQNWVPRQSVNVEKVTLRDIEAHVSSKLELYNLLTTQCQLYLPPLKMTPVSHLRRVLSGEAKVFQNHEIVAVNAPRFKEFTVGKIFQMVSEIPAIMAYLPSDIPGEKLDRQFLFNIVNTITPSFFAQVIPAAEEKRIRPRDEDDLIHLDPKMLHLIKCFRVTRNGTKKGGLHLLKKNTRKRKRAQQQAAFDLAISVKDSLKDCSTEVDIFKRLQQKQLKGRVPM